MLIRASALAVAVSALGGIHVAADSSCQTHDLQTALCISDASSGASTPGGGNSSSDSGGKGKRSQACLFEGREIACRTGVGVWNNAGSAWCRDITESVPLTESVWEERTEGRIIECTRPRGDLVPDPSMTYRSWQADNTTPAPDPEDLAERILASLDLVAPELHTFPQGDTEQHMGITGWNMWLWSAAPTAKHWGPVTASASENGVTVTLTAGVSSVTWDMGNGDTVTCGKGTEWSSARTDGGKNIASPTCGYIYEAMGRYTVTATSTWRVDWTGGGRSGTLPLELERSVPMRVGEIQSVIVSNR